MSRIEEIEKAIAAADAKRCLAALAGASEAERKQMAPRAIELAKWDVSMVTQRDALKRSAQHEVAVLALFGTASLGQIKRASVMAHPVYPVLAERRPEWLSEWAAWALSHASFSYFSDIRKLIQRGLIAKPATDEYVLAVISCLAPVGKVKKRLASDPDVFTEDIWRFFELEGNQSSSLASSDKFGGGWKDGLVQLAAEGVLDRSRLLDCSLDALERDFSPFRAAWFSAFHEAMKPSLDESAQRGSRYLALLGSRAPSTVSFAMKIVSKLDKAGKLEADEICSMIGPALTARQKGVVANALGVLSRIARTKPSLQGMVAECSSAALSHESPEIQKSAVDLVEFCGHAAAAKDAADSLAPTQRARLGVVAMDAEAPLPRRLAPVAITPIRDFDELVEALSAVIEKEEPPEEIERVLDAVSRFCGMKPDRFAALMAPLIARAEKLPGAVLSPLLMAWARGTNWRPAPAFSCLMTFLNARVQEVAERAIAGRAVPLVGVPSHAGGSLDPLVFVERLRVNRTPDQLDLIQGLLRLSGANRREALAAAAKLPGETGKAIRYALGSGRDLAKPAGDPLWTAAAQARDPRWGAPEFQLTWRTETRHYFNEDHTHWIVALEPSREISRKACFPGDLTSNPGTQDAPMLRWCATVWPGNREGFYAAGAQAIARNLDWWSAEWGNRVFLETLAADALPYGPMAFELLALGLAAKEPGEAMAASDALVNALADGRVTGRALGETCARLATRGKITISRWTKRLGAVARMRRAFACELFTVQDRLLADLAPIGSNEMSGFLELLCELRAQSGFDLSREARLRLEKSAPGGKSAKLAKSLL